MTAEKIPDPDEVADVLEGAVLNYTYRMAGGEEIDLEAFVGEFPAPVREELRARCEQADRIQNTLRRGAASTASGLPPGAGMKQFERIGKYEPIRELGAGSMGVVFLARCTETGEDVALKVLAFNLAVSARAVQRFRREMAAASKLEHPGIVEIIEVGEDLGLLFIAMEYIEGPSLEELLECAAHTHAAGGSAELDLPRRAGDPTGPVGRVAKIVLGVAEALQHAHQRGIIHRDVKPANILIDAEGRPKLLDFGLAKDVSELSISGTGDLAGTPCYMSPEQAMSKRVEIDHRTDIFSLGVVFYEMLARHRPFAGDTLQRLFFEITFKEPEPLRRLRPDLPRDAITICEKAISKDPDHRFPDAGEMAQDLRRFLNHESIVARPVGAVRKWFRRARGRPTVTGFAAAAVLALLIAPLLLVWWGRRERLAQTLEAARPLLEIEAYSLDESREVWEALRVEKELRAFDPAPQSKAGRAIADLEKKRLSLAERMEAFFENPSAPENSWMNTEVWGARSARCRLFAPMLRSGELQAPDGGEELDSCLSITSDPPGAEVYLQPLSRLDGRRLGRWKLGTTPLDDLLVDPGLLRIIVILEGHGSAELTRDLGGFGAEYGFHVALRRTEEVKKGMIEISEEPFIFGYGPEEDWPFHEREMTLKAFWADRDEVSNAEYREYVEATGDPAAPFWPEPWDEDWNDQPVVGVTRDAAQAFAEWAGKRLPTLAEWQRMARGTSGAFFPEEVDVEAGEVPDFGKYAMGRGPAPDEGTTELTFEKYIAFVHSALDPVNQEGTPTGPEGLMHTLDNVSEWTESYSPGRTLTGRIYTINGLANWMGGCWSMRGGYDLAQVGEAPPTMEDSAQGFRCVKTVDP